ncbi:MAG TPA: hypothetical protein VMD05_05250 [Candidatus Nanoarchaeia archaeon]|nr:hypothetical protein [Candidatus Nanoarchaeia archaeon]
MPATSIDTFLACTVIITATLIATGFLFSSMQTSINNTKDINKNSYLQSIAEQIITNPGSPTDWGASNLVPTDFGLARSTSNSYELDIDKVSRLNSQNYFSLQYADMLKASKLNNVALGISASQVMSIIIQQTSDDNLKTTNSFNFTVSTNINSEPTNANLTAYVFANNVLENITADIQNTEVGVNNFAVQIPTNAEDNAMLVVFARASFDSRITSYGVYSFLSAAQEIAPSNDTLVLTPINYTLSIMTNLSDLTIQNGYILSFDHQQTLSLPENGSQCLIPKLIDQSPYVIILNGVNNGTYVQTWTAYPQIPLNAGSSFSGSEQNVFSYTVTINDVLYKVEISFGDVTP